MFVCIMQIKFCYSNCDYHVLICVVGMYFSFFFLFQYSFPIERGVGIWTYFGMFWHYANSTVPH